MNHNTGISGERSSSAKLTWAIVDEIRASQEQGKTLAIKFRVSQMAVSQVRTGQRWREENRPRQRADHIIEEWRVCTPNGRYEASRSGKIRNARSKWTITGYRDAKGYIRTMDSGTGKTVKFHILIAFAFYGPRPAGMQVSHRDGNQTNNHADNLCYETPKENIARQAQHGTKQAGEASCRSKLSWFAVDVIRANVDTLTALATRFSVSVSAIRSVRTGKAWKPENRPTAAPTKYSINKDLKHGQQHFTKSPTHHGVRARIIKSRYVR